MNTLHYRVRTVEILHLVDGLWSSSAFIHREGEEQPCHILLHAGKSRCNENAQHLARRAAEQWLHSEALRDSDCAREPSGS